ncbi:MAG: ABC transporter ATP-binding protein [Bacteroidales bacterium]|nr:ABC transporter ATP-binding protein [Bacteroidales bacterium]
MPEIDIQHINKRFGKIEALHDINITVEQGEVFGLVGPDGAGKSTLFNILTTLLLPDSGKVDIMGMDVVKDYLQIRQSIGYLPGVFSLYPDLSVQENLAFFATMYKSSILDNMSLIKPIWKQLLPFKTRPAGKLSGGMKQKLSLCCALIHKPKILFLDEPTTGVDPVSRKEFWDILKDIQHKGVTVVVSTPYMDEATRCDRIALIQNGNIIKIDTPNNIIGNFRGHLYTVKMDDIFGLMQLMNQFELTCNYYPYGEHFHIAFYDEVEKALPAFERFLQDHGRQYDEIKPITPNIEDCFIELMQMKQL